MHSVTGGDDTAWTPRLPFGGAAKAALVPTTVEPEVTEEKCREQSLGAVQGSEPQMSIDTLGPSFEIVLFQRPWRCRLVMSRAVLTISEMPLGLYSDCPDE